MTTNTVIIYVYIYIYMNAPHGCSLKKKSLAAITQECCKQYWTSPGDSTLQSTNQPSQKLSKLNEPDARDTAGEVGSSSQVMYSCGPLHMYEQRQDVQFEPTYSSSLPIRDVALRICQKQWTIGRCGERGAKKIRADSATWWWYIYIYIYINTYIYNILYMKSLPFMSTSLEHFSCLLC